MSIYRLYVIESPQCPGGTGRVHPPNVGSLDILERRVRGRPIYMRRAPMWPGQGNRVPLLFDLAVIYRGFNILFKITE